MHLLNHHHAYSIISCHYIQLCKYYKPATRPLENNLFPRGGKNMDSKEQTKEEIPILMFDELTAATDP